MTFPTYSEYKGSGFEWLGQVPEHWQIKALRYLTICLDGKRIPLNGEQRADKQGDVPYWGANAIMDFVDEAIFDEELLLVGEDGAPFLDPFKPVAFHSSGPVWPNNHIHVLRPNRREWVRFLVYAMNAADYANFIEGSTRQKLNQSRLMGMPVCWPSYAEQTQIARFLDHETARIDALIGEQQRLIELLKEKRQAVISHAVTKGLDPTVSMKESGVEWLGEVPAHWVVKSMKHLVEDGESVSYGIVQPGDHQDEGVPFIQTTNMSSGDFSFEALQRTSPEIEANYPRSRLHGGEVILGIRATIGAAFVVPESLKNINLSRGVARIACSEQVLADYLVYFLSGRAAFEYWGLAKQGSTFSEVSIATVRELPVTVPPLIEQQELIEHMEQAIKSLDDLTLIGERTMALLRERRSALISAAVTGKIDVRGWQPQSSAPTPELVQEAV